MIKALRIIFDAACHTDSISRNPECRPSVDIFSLWDANQIETPEGRRYKNSKPPISLLRSRGQPRVDKHEWNAARMSFGCKIGPNLRFNENDPHRPNHSKRASHYWPVIERRVHDFHPG